MSTRWKREFVAVNTVRLDELNKKFSDDPTFSEERYEAACRAIDVLEEPELRAAEAYFREKMARIEALTERLNAAIADAKRLLQK